ncbi:hypothetical protein M501DRAFT_902685, partial [Patellaria atrata CBS 101060]
ALPQRFPCWVKAVYSWGGETKRDLGFIEGDLIECLNAGDGSWWMGRLKRDRRMIGLFPSNFVKVLDDDYQPWSRNVSPLAAKPNGGSISRGVSPNPGTAKPTPQKTKSTFRKPFQAYYKAGAPNPTAAKRELEQKSGSPGGGSPNLGSFSKHKPYSSMKRTSNEGRASSPLPPRNENINPRATSPLPPRKENMNPRATSPLPPRNERINLRSTSPLPPLRNDSNSRSRAPSPLPLRNERMNFRATSPLPPQRMNSNSRSRAPSPAPPQQYQAYSPIPSPVPFHHQHQYSRAPSPNPYEDVGSSPPPPAPPPHRVAYNPSRVPSPMAQYDDTHQYGSGYHTPGPPSPMPERNNFTPSPLTNAMNDVMSSLQDMSVSRQNSIQNTQVPGSPEMWSPEAFDQAYSSNTRKLRAHTSMGIDDWQDDGPPQVKNYVRRMESRLRKMQQQEERRHKDELFLPTDTTEPSPAPPPKNSPYMGRPQSSDSQQSDPAPPRQDSRRLKNRKSAYELSREALGRTFTTKTIQSTTTNSSNTTQSTNRSLMSHSSAGGVSATSAGSLARRKWGLGGTIKERPQSVMDTRQSRSIVGFNDRPESPFTGVSYHSSHDSRSNNEDWATNVNDGGGILGGLAAPKPKKSGFFKKMIESAKTGAASARTTISSNPSSRPVSRQSKMIPSSFTGISGGQSRPGSSAAARDMGLGSCVDWVQVRRDVNRSNSLSKNEKVERAERCQMMDIAVINPVDILTETVEGDEGLDGLPILDPTDFTLCNLALVDKSSRFINNLPPMTTPASLAQGYVCRPYRSDVQRLRAIFTWVSERVAWEEDFVGEIDSRRVIQTKRGCSKEIALLVAEMCSAMGLHAEIVRGYLKSPGEALDFDMVARPNHWWNTVIVDGEWRIMDCSLANPTNPKRSQYSSAGSHVADGWWFLTRPTEICYTHVPLLPEQQHICPPLAHDILMALPCTCPPYFKNGLELVDFDTSLLNLDNLEMAHINFYVPEDVECVAEVEARQFARDPDGDFFESGELVRKRALAQAEWIGGRKRYTVKAILPGDEGQAILKVYTGKRGLMHSIKSNPHPLSFALPLTHSGTNPPYDFLILHPTPHAQRHDLYVAQPQCARLAVNNTFVFTVRQNPSSTASSPDPSSTTNNGRTTPNPFVRPTSALSMISTSASGSQYSNPSSAGGSAGSVKPAKLAVQSPAGKIIRFTRKSEHMMGAGENGDGTTWETVIKIGERGIWRGLVLADRSARWCVFAEWEC